jgi:hypothetical protein
MCTGKAFEYMRFTSEELRTLVRYVDPNGDGDLTKDELSDAIRRFNANDNERELEHQSAAIMAKLEVKNKLCIDEHLKKKYHLHIYYFGITPDFYGQASTSSERFI